MSCSCLLLNFSSHPLLALKLASPNDSEYISAFPCNSGPLTDFWLRHCSNHLSNHSKLVNYAICRLLQDILWPFCIFLTMSNFLNYCWQNTHWQAKLFNNIFLFRTAIHSTEFSVTVATRRLNCSSHVEKKSNIL